VARPIALYADTPIRRYADPCPPASRETFCVEVSKGNYTISAKLSPQPTFAPKVYA
jgi:hypothetical protein